MKIVLDTNVLVSGLLKKESSPSTILSLSLRKELRLCLSKPIFNEYKTVLLRPKFRQLDQRSIQSLLKRLYQTALWTNPTKRITVITRDPADNRFLECALASTSNFLITGNKTDFSFDMFHETCIVTPSDFILIYTELINKI